MPFEIVPFSEDHVEDAASMVAARYRVERSLTPFLPPRFENPDALLLRLRNLAQGAPGVAAKQDGTLVGFLLAYLSPFRGVRTAYSPDFGHAADPVDRRDIYRGMYASLSRYWLAHGCFSHAVTLFAHEREAIDAWYSVGFGLTVIDALRDVGHGDLALAGVEIHRATPEDVDLITPLALALRRHLAAPPIFIPLIIEERRDDLMRWLSESANALWVAFQDSDAVAFLRLEPSGFDVLPTSEESTVSISGAFTKEAVRGQGLGMALLNQALNWARLAGYKHCSVDFESANIPSSRFWLGRGFEPVCHSLTRQVDDRLSWAGEGRDTEGLLCAYQGRAGAG